VKFEGRSALALAPADQLLYLSVRLPGSTPAHSSLWTADALQVLQAAGIGFGWGRLPEQAASHQVLVLARILLTRLAEYFSVSVPGTTLRQLQDLPVSWWERLEARYRRKQADERLLGILPLLWFDFMRARGPQGTRAIAIGFGNYLEEYWQVDSRQELLGLMLRLSARRLSAMLSGIGWRVRDRESS
jgi:hypothetical protein